MAQPEPESTPESELPAAPQEKPKPSAGISWWLTVIYIVTGIAVVGLATIIVISKRRH